MYLGSLRIQIIALLIPNTDFSSTSGPVLQNKQDLVLDFQVALYDPQIEFEASAPGANDIIVGSQGISNFFLGGRKEESYFVYVLSSEKGYG